MLVLTFLLPILLAVICLALNQRVATRWLGIASAAGLLVCAVALMVARVQGQLPLTLLARTWLTLDQHILSADLLFDAANWLFALLAYGAGGLALLLLALAVPSNVRGFGSLFAAAGLAVCAIVAGLATQSLLLLPFSWALAALLTFFALRASGALEAHEAPLLVLLAGFAGALVLLGIALALSVSGLGALPLAAMLVGWLLLALLVLGGPPFHAHIQALADAPAALVGALLPVGLPLLGGYTLIRFFASPAGALTPGWRFLVTLIGLATLLCCAAGALRSTRLRQIVSWQLSAQLGLLLLAFGQPAPALALAAPALLLNAVLTALAGLLAVAVIERRAGTDDLAEIELPAPLLLAGVTFLVGTASAVGWPGTWGFWARRWLYDELLRSTPWALPLLLAGTALLALASLAPLALFWRRAAQLGAEAAEQRVPVAEQAVLALSIVPLLALGVLPQLAWRGWLADLPRALLVAAPASLPLPGMPAQIAGGIAALLLLALPFAIRASRRAAPLPDTQPRMVGVIAPQALGESLRGLAWLAMPSHAFDSGWRGLLRASSLLRRGLALFEQRYYLAGLLIAMIVVIMLFVQ